MSAGKKLNFWVRIGVTYGFGTKQELLSSGATRIAGHAQEIMEFFQ